MNQDALDAVHQRCKQAAGFTDAVQMQHGATLRGDALKQLGRLLLTGAGVGMAGRGLYGLAQLTKRNLSPPTGLSNPTVSVDVPYPAAMLPPEEEEEKVAGFANFMQGDYAKNPAGIPWMIPATVLGGGASIYGGWKLMDSILDARRKAELKGDVDDARNDFQQALLSEYDRPVQTPSLDKIASDDSLGADLDRLFLAVKKAGLLEDTLHGSGIATGLYGTAAGVAGLAAALGAYNATKKRREQELLAKAHKMRLRNRWAQQPPPLQINPVAMPTV